MRTRPVYLASPYLVGLALLVALPALGAVALALTDFSGVEEPRFIGLDNFFRLVGSGAFWRALGNSLVYVGLSVPLRVAAAVGLALLLHWPGRGIPPARTVAYLPTVVPEVAYALVWLWLLNPLYGPLGAGLSALGVPAPDWLTQPWPARIAVALVAAFQVGEGFVVALAARRMIPPRLYDAAAVDGASPWFTLRRLTLPLMAPILALLALRDVVLALQTNFVPALVLTGGGPRYATTFLPLYVYQQAFSYFRLGYASAATVVMFFATAAIVAVQYALARRWKLL